MTIRVLADSTSDAVAGFGGVTLLFFIVCAALYFLPVIVAVARHSHQTAVVVIIDIFLGWTLIGWVIALAMAFMRPPVVVVAPAASPYHWNGREWVALPPGYPPPPPAAPAAPPSVGPGMQWVDGEGWRAG